MIQKKTKLALTALLAFGISTSAIADGHGAKATETIPKPTVAADPSVTECKESTAPIIPDGNVASQDELLAAQKAYKVFQDQVIDYRECLLVLEANMKEMNLDPKELEAKLAANLAADNASVDKLESVAEEFNVAVRAFKAR